MKRGFTLIELLVVIGIIGMLATIVTYSIFFVKARSRDSIRVADVSQFTKIMDLYLNETGAYPVSTTALCLDGSDLVITALQSANLTAANIKDPLFTDTTNCYRYISDSDGKTFSVRYFLETSSVEAKGFHTVTF